jgi:mono/diheme cytochrome c family protein
MLSARLALLPLIGLSVLAGPAAASAPESAITHAAIAPYEDVLRHDAVALCGDLTPEVAAELFRTAVPTTECSADASRVFASSAQDEPRADPDLTLEPSVTHLEVAGQHAKLTLSFQYLTVAKKREVSMVTVHYASPVKLQLEEVSGHWLVSSRATLGTVPGCRLAKPRLCQPGAHVLLFYVGEPEQPEEELPLPPAFVRRAGGHEVSEYEAGKRVVAQSGCLACHRIGDGGNRGPGRNLTHVGSRLSGRQIAHALVDPQAPMPSFRHLPAQKLHDIVRFLALLR